MINLPHSCCELFNAWKKHEATIYYDDINSKICAKISIKRKQVDTNTVPDTKLIAFDGQAIWIDPLKK